MRVRVLATLASIAFLVGSAGAQDREWAATPTVALVAGEFIPDNPKRLDAGASVVGLRLGKPLGSVFVAEAGVSYAMRRVETADHRAARVVAADLGVQAQLPHARYRPYVGVGAGVMRSATRPEGTVPALSAVVGARLPATANVLLLGEIRARSPLREGGVQGTEQAFGLVWRI